MEIMRMMANEAMEASQAVQEEARSHSEPHLTTAVEPVLSSADPSTPNTKPAAVGLLDEDSNSSECNGDGTAACDMPPGRRRGRGRALKKSRKRNYSTRMPLVWTAPTPPDSTIAALFVSDKEAAFAQKPVDRSTTVPSCIPLWPTYKLDITGPGSLPLDITNWRWLHIATREAWWTALAGLDPANLTETKELLRAAILSSRNHRGVINDDSESDDEKSTPGRSWRTVSFKKATALKIKVLDYTLTALNSLRPIALRCDEDTVSFLNAIVVPSIIKARSQSVTILDTETPAPFNFSGEEKFHFPGKVVWMPTTSSYKLQLRGEGVKQLDKSSTTTDLEGKPLQLPAGLTGRTFHDAKRRLCRLACQAWDQRDTSKRPRFYPGGAEKAEGTAP